jgi:hypothetical protein
MMCLNRLKSIAMRALRARAGLGKLAGIWTQTAEDIGYRKGHIDCGVFWVFQLNSECFADL